MDVELRTFFARKWNIYLRFYFDWVVESIAYTVYFAIHMGLVTFFIGFCFYVRAMRSDLVIQMESIDSNTGHDGASIGREIARRLSREIRFHARIFE